MDTNASSGRVPCTIHVPNWVGFDGFGWFTLEHMDRSSRNLHIRRRFGGFDPDLAVGREFPITERSRLRLRVEAFNLLNHTNFKEPNTSLTVTTNSQGQPIFNSPGFGVITDTRAARFLQLVARYEF